MIQKPNPKTNRYHINAFIRRGGLNYVLKQYIKLYFPFTYYKFLIFYYMLFIMKLTVLLFVSLQWFQSGSGGRFTLYKVRFRARRYSDNKVIQICIWVHWFTCIYLLLTLLFLLKCNVSMVISYQMMKLHTVNYP